MKTVWASVAVAIAIAAAVIGHFLILSRELHAFCDSLSAGMPISEVREAATERGYDPRMEPYTQMSIEPRSWHFAKPACKVFFNKDHTVEYKSWQGG